MESTKITRKVASPANDALGGIQTPPPQFKLDASTANSVVQREEAPAKDSAGAETSGDPLKVEKGQVTFDAEGNNVEGNKYFSRVIHWPGTDASGVTIGRGYDMGNRSEASILEDMKAAGVSDDQASKIAAAHGKKGADAKQFVVDNKEGIGQISEEQQKKLFELVYAEYEGKAKNRASNWGSYAQLESDKDFMLTSEQYDALHPRIKELLVDFTYRGDYRSKGHAAYSKVNPILKEDVSGSEKMKKLKTLLETYRDGLPKGDFMITRTNARISLMDTGIAEATITEQQAPIQAPTDAPK
jgi:hypothetical protein